MKKNGFVFIETIITVVVLSTALLLIYHSYSGALNKEKDRLYYDDVAYIYRTNFLRSFLENHSNIDNIKTYSFGDTYIQGIGSGLDSMFTDEQKTQNMNSALDAIVNNYHINQMILLKSDYVLNCHADTAICRNSITGISYNMSRYIKTLGDASYKYYLVVEYAERIEESDGSYVKCNPGIDTKCNTYYVSMGI
ncbi:MAG: hypothetical protein K2M17_05465 [Bacilli bacterium]|nr:hypothetical protein [Bacilli bacterium]